MKSKSTNKRHKGNARTHYVRRPLPLCDENLMGFLIYRPDTDEFLFSHTSGLRINIARYVKEPALAYLFSTEQLAFRYSTFIDKETFIVKLYDLVDMLVVRF